jgi:hypothetical protein
MLRALKRASDQLGLGLGNVVKLEQRRFLNIHEYQVR